MARNPLPLSSNPSDDSDSEEEIENESDAEEEQLQVDADALIQNNDDDEADEDLEDEAEEAGDEEEPDKEPMEAEESSEKIASPARGLDYGSDADSGKSTPSPSLSPSDYILKENSEVKKKKKKRSAESEPIKENHEAKKSKKAVNGGEGVVFAEEKVKKLIWKPEDELKIVNGMLEYKEETGIDYNSNLDSFYKYIKGMLNVVVDKSQLVNKIRKLKEKFRDIAAKEANGEELALKSHEEEMYEVSKSVWGEQIVGRSNGKGKKEKSVSVYAPAVEVKTKKDKSLFTDVPVVESKSKTTKSVYTDASVEESKSKKEKNVVTDMHMLEVDSVLALPVPDTEMSKKEVNDGSVKTASKVRKSVKKPKVVTHVEFYEAHSEEKSPVISIPAMVNDFVFERGLELVEKSKLDALNEKWTRYQIEAAELHLKKLDLIKEHTKLRLDALKSNQ